MTTSNTMPAVTPRLMRYKLLGSSGLRVSELCLGTMTFGEDWGWGASKEESRRIFDAYVEHGGNFIDTSNNYTDGSSERFVGEFTHAQREKFIIATKYSLSEDRDDPNMGGNHRKNMVQSLERSLKRLQTDYVDLFWLHMWDSTTPIEVVMRALDDQVRSGKVLHVGLSDSPAWVAARGCAIAELRGWSPFVALQFPYSLNDRDVERELIPMAAAHGMAITPWGVLDGGGLTGKYNTPSDEPKRDDDVSDQVKQVAAEVMRLAQEIGRTPAQVALNWVRQQQRAVNVPIIGARTEKQMRDNLGALDFTLTDDQLKRLSSLSSFKLGFPYAFLNSDHVRGLIFGETYSRIDP